MFLSKLLLNLRHPFVRRDLADPYRLHQTLRRVVPKNRPEGTAPAKEARAELLFRVETDRIGAGPFILIQTAHRPDWSGFAVDYLAEPPAPPKDLSILSFHVGQRLRFRLRANPTKRAGKSVSDAQWVGKRVGLMSEEDQLAWLLRKADQSGFRIPSSDEPANGLKVFSVRIIPEGNVVARKKDHTLTCLAVRFEGLLEVTDPVRFRQTLAEGIGSAKGLGFGLLSLARAEE